MAEPSHTHWPRRALRHALFGRNEATRAFPSDTLDAITQAIAAGELTHRGEVCIIVEKSLPFASIREALSPRQRALALFAEHGVWDTDERCGVLVYINLADRKVEIVADRGIARKIDGTVWETICATMTAGFAQDRYREATLTALDAINALLAKHFPANGARQNELPDRPITL